MTAQARDDRTGGERPGGQRPGGERLGDEHSGDELRADGNRSALVVALCVSAVASVLLVCGSLLPVVDGAEPGFASTPVLVVLAVLPVVVAAACALRGRIAVGVGVLVGVAALAPGRAVLDLQFTTDPSRALRPELYLPSDLQAHAPTAGLWLLVAGHAVAVLAGLLALRARPGAGQEGEPTFTEPEESDGTAGEDSSGTTVADVDPATVPGSGGGRPMRRLAAVVVVAIVAAVGVLMQPFSSEYVYLLAQNAFEGPTVAMAGFLLIAAALPLAAAVAVSSADHALSRGALYGLAVGGLSLVVPALWSGIAVESLGLGAGPVVALAGLVGLVVVGGLPAPSADTARNDDPADVQLPGSVRLLTATGVLAVITGVLAVLGALTRQIETQGPVDPPDSPARWTLLAAGIVVGLLGTAMFVPRWAVRTRPVLSVSWVAVVLTGAAVLDTAVTATGTAGGVATAGQGVVWTWVAMLAAAVTACCCVIAGAAERDDAEDTVDAVDAKGAVDAVDTAAPLNTAADTGPADTDGARRGGRPVGLIVALILTGLLAVVAFGLPVFTARDYEPSGLWTHFGTPSWGLLGSVLVVLGALALVPWSRPGAAVGALCGVGVVLATHAASFPLVRGEIAGVAPGPGFWFAFAALIAVLAAAMAAALRGPARAHPTVRAAGRRS